MIHSIAITVTNPLRVAKALVEIWDGHILQFPFFPNSYVVLAKDEHTTSVEIYPNNVEFVLKENSQTVEFFYNLLIARLAGQYAAISVPANLAQIQEIAVREGWNVVQPTEGSSRSMVIWIENQIKLELLPRNSQLLEIAR